MSATPGRNDPCYCGSGKKYKQCHMKADKQTTRDRLAHQAAVTWLRRDLMRYAREERFAVPFATALEQYWAGLYTFDHAAEMSEAEAFRFFDWFLHDYEHLDDDGDRQPRLVETYHAEKQDDLASEQQKVLDEWLVAAPANAYEFLSVDEHTLQLRQFLDGDEIEAYSTAGRGNMSVGDLLLIRLLPMHDRLQFSTTGAYIPQNEIGDLREKLAAARADFEAENPDGDAATFWRRHNHLIIHHALDQAEKAGRPPVARLDPDRPDKRTQKVVRQMKRLQR